MPTLSITVDDTIVPRVLAAYGVATNAQLKAAIIAGIKAKVVDYETVQAEITEAAKVKAADDARRVAISNTQATAQNEIILS